MKGKNICPWLCRPPPGNMKHHERARMFRNYFKGATGQRPPYPRTSADLLSLEQCWLNYAKKIRRRNLLKEFFGIIKNTDSSHLRVPIYNDPSGIYETPCVQASVIARGVKQQREALYRFLPEDIGSTKT
jgi:hypothetical protein